MVIINRIIICKRLDRKEESHAGCAAMDLSLLICHKHIHSL
jgi:hypothetical protein